VQDAEFYVSSLREVGIEATINVIDKTEIVDQVWRQDNTEFCVCNKPTFAGTNGEAFTFYHSAGNLANPYKLLADRELDSLIEKQGAELNPEARKAVLFDVQRKILETAVAVPIFSRKLPEALQPNVRGYQHATQDPHRFAEVWTAA
jgi:ABC-type transport system substrate-binding protein